MMKQNVARVARGMLFIKIAETVLQNIHRIELLQHVAAIGGNWLCMQLPCTFVQDRFEDAEFPVRVENQK